ncbi:MAG: DNA-binding domain-containing protein [Aureliella sp.]
MILPSKLLSSQQRMGIYANAYYARLLECLRDEFPALVSLLGEETFNAFGMDYLQSHPSQSYTLADLGQYFPAYLRENQTLALDEDAGAESSTAPDDNSYCFDLMIDLALLERTYSEVFSGQGIEDQQTLCADELATILPDQISNLRLLPSPCVRLLKLHTQAHQYAIAVRKGTASNSRLPARAPAFLVITRLHYVVRTIDAESLEFELLEHLMNNVCLGDAIARVAESSMFADSLSDEQQWTNGIYEWFQK